MRMMLLTCLAVGGGVFLGWLLFSDDDRALPDDSLDRARRDVEKALEKQRELQISVAATEKELATVRVALEASERRNAQLESAAAVALNPRPVTPADEETGLAIQFGEYGELEEILNADWAELAQAMGNMQAELTELLEALVEGETPDPSLLIRIAKENSKLQQFALLTNGKLPTHASGNGEFTHPITTTNLLANYLEQEEIPLTAHQRETIAISGEEYEQEWRHLAQGYSDNDLDLQKVLDEARLKAAFMSDLDETLAPSQLDAIYQEDTRGVLGFDLFSPGLMFAGRSQPLGVGSVDELRPTLLQRMAHALEVPAEDLESHADVFDRWVADIGELSPVSQDQVALLEFDQMLNAGEAQAHALEQLRRRLQLSPETLERLRQDTRFFVPRLVQPDHD